ncbi:unnamed protein product [Prorocentrum cordatum]|uniref:Uncharacterized protein n=1 Tax=Prorocentrum cordatum TaxID=2364126 RepID=A0ABN9U0K7_9DINO|nr:unnamed protein product [Polarella glacialis]
MRALLGRLPGGERVQGIEAALSPAPDDPQDDDESKKKHRHRHKQLEVRADLGTVCARAAVSFLWREHPQAAARHSGAPGAGAGGGVPLQRHPRASAVPTATTATS